MCTERATTWGVGERNICEGVEYVGRGRGGENVKYITHDVVEILTSKRRETTR